MCVCTCMVSSPLSACAAAAQAPVVTVEPRAATVRQGESVSFRCQVGGGGGGGAVLEWKRANNQALPGQHKPPVSSTNNAVRAVSSH